MIEQRLGDQSSCSMFKEQIYKGSPNASGALKSTRMKNVNLFAKAMVLLAFIVSSTFGYGQWTQTQQTNIFENGSGTFAGTGDVYYATDNNGDHYVAYTEYLFGSNGTWDHLRVKKFNTTTNEWEQLGSNSYALSDEIRHPKIAFDASNNLHIAYTTLSSPESSKIISYDAANDLWNTSAFGPNAVEVLGNQNYINEFTFSGNDPVLLCQYSSTEVRGRRYVAPNWTNGGQNQTGYVNGGAVKAANSKIFYALVNSSRVRVFQYTSSFTYDFWAEVLATNVYGVQLVTASDRLYMIFVEAGVIKAYSLTYGANTFVNLSVPASTSADETRMDTKVDADGNLIISYIESNTVETIKYEKSSNTWSSYPTISAGLPTTPWRVGLNILSNGEPMVSVSGQSNGIAKTYIHTSPPPPPTITSFSPTSGAVGSTVIITGTNFDATAANNVVYFGGVKATVTAATATQLTVTAPNSSSSGSLLQVTNLSTGLSVVEKYGFQFEYNGVSASAAIQPLFTTQNTGTGPSLFGEGTGYNTMGQKMCAGDFNNDGKTDFVALGISGNTSLQIYTNVGSNGADITSSTFSNSSFTLTNSHYAVSQYPADLNQDGLLDLVVGGANYIAVLINTTSGGTISFNEILIPTASATHSRIKFADVDGDGWLDILSVGNQNKVNIIKIDSFTAPNSLSTSYVNITQTSNVMDFDLEDFDNDGKLDFVVQKSGMSISYALNNSTPGTIAFTNTSDIVSGVSSGSYPHWGGVVSADFDLDGDIDVVYSLTGGAGQLINMLRNDAGTFSAPFGIGSFTGTSNMPSSLRVFDFNGDGKLDIATTAGSNSGGLRAILNDYSSGTMSSSDFTNISTIFSGTLIGAVIEDFNQNGRLDIIHNQYYNATLNYYTNKALSSISVTGTLSAFSTCVGTPSNQQSVTVSGSSLTADINVAALSGYEYSLDGTTWSSTVTIPQNGGSASATLYVRLTGATAGTPSGNITLSSTGASNATIAASGTVYAYPTLVITDPAVQCTVGGTVDITAAAVTAGSTPAGLTFTYFSDALATTTLASPSTVAASGTYYIVGSNNGCTDTASVDVNILTTAMSAVTLAVDDKPCGATATGSMTVTITDGVGPFTYAWTRNGTAYTATPADAPTNLLPGTYVVTVTDACGTVVASSGVNLTTAPSLSIVGTPAQNGTIICSGATTGSITGVIQGGSAPRTLSVTNTGTNMAYTSSVPTGSPAAGQYAFEVTGLPAGTYTVEAYDGVSSCNDTWNGTITISEPNAISINNTILDACYGQSNGSITVTASGGTGTLEYSIDNSTYQASNQFTSLSPNTYTVYVQDANNCIDSATAVVNQPNVALSVSATATTNVDCFGQSTGAVTVQGAGGDGTYTYSINGTTFAASATFTGLAAGTYTITVKDGSNCTETVDVTITQPAAALSATTSVVDVLCFGQSTGEATVTPAGGTGPYAYAWSGSQTMATITGQAAGTYTVTVTDANLCTTTASATIATSPAITLTATATDITCNGDGDGTVTAVAGGGAAPYAYSWNSSPAQTTATATGLQAGTYTVTLTDNNGCQATASATINEPAQVVASVGTPTDVLCFGGATGSVTASATGGTVAGAYSFSWNDANTQTTATASNLLAGSYTVTVEDDNGCQATASATIAQPASAVDLASSGIVNVNCFGGQTGEFVVTATGGTSPYDISMTSPSTSTITAATETYSNLFANTYEVSVEDANGCIDTDMVTITQGTQVTYSTVVTDACNPNNDGSITFTASGGTAPYEYSIDNGTTWATTASFTGLAAGVYDILVRDSYNCTTAANTETVYTAASPLAVSIVETSTATCYQVDDAVLTSTVSGGQSTYTYVWSDNSTSASISAGTQGTAYSVVVTDSYGCTATSNTITTTTITDMVPTTSVSNVTCNGTSDGSIDLSSISGGSSASYNYSWDGTNYTAFAGSTVTNGSLSAGSYTLYIQDQTNTSCVSQTTLTVTEPAVLAGTVVATDVTCNGSNDGTITITGATGGSGSYEYSIDGGTTWQSSNTFTGLSNATYDVQIRDAGVVTCIIDLDGASNTVIAQPTALTASISAQTNNLCNGDTDGTATVTAAGGTAPYSYSWTGGATTAAISSLAAGAYTVTVTDANSCTVSATATITEPSLLEIYDDGISDASCSNTTDGAIPVSAFGGTGSYTYAWTGPNGFTSTQEDQLFNLAPGTYSVTVTDANGCTATASNLVVGSPTAVTLTATGTDLTCYESNDGTATVTYSGGTSPYGFAWTFNGAPFATAQNLTGLAAGDYEVTITDANFCQYTSSTLTITQPAQLTATVSAATPVCSGENAVFTITGTAGEVVTYTINGGTSASATIGVSGTVDVTIAAVSADQAFAMVSVSDGTCTNAYTGTATVVVNSLPTASAGADQSVCDGTDVTLAGSGGVSYAWDNGVTDNVAFTVTNNTNAPVTTTYTLTITDANGCTATDQVDVTVNPTPTVDAVADQEVCANASTTTVAFASTFNVAGTTYSWTNDNTSIGLAASGTGDIASFTALNTGTTAEVATITVIPSANGCDGTPVTFTITVEPAPVVDPVANITYCGGVGQSPITFTGTPNTVFNWTATNNVGFFLNGTASPSIGGYQINPATQVVSTVTVTPEITAGGNTCTGAPITFTVTVNPTPSIADATETICSGGTFTVTPTNTNTAANAPFDGDLVPTGTSYSWSAPSVTGITGAMAGTNETTINGTLVNTTNAPIDVTYTVTPTSADGCVGETFDVVVTVNPAPSIANETATVCSNETFNVIPTNAGVNNNIVPVGTVYSWSAPAAVTGITGLAAGTNETDINGTLVNTTSSPIDVTYTVTPMSGSCTGATFDVVVTINPEPTISTQTITVCSNELATVTPVDGNNGDLVPANTTYSWSAPSVAGITGLASGTNESDFNATLVNTTDNAITVTYAVTPASDGCTGMPFNVEVTVNPTPIIGNDAIAVCSNEAFIFTPTAGGTNNNIVPIGTTYSWPAPAAVTGLSGIGSSGIGETSLNATLINATTSALSVTYTVTPSIGGCTGTPFDVVVTVNPTPVIASTSETVCSGELFTVSPTNGTDLVPLGTVYSWSAPMVAGITGTVAGTNETNISATLVNTTSAAIDVTYTVTPSVGSCVGTPFDVVVTVEPTPSIADKSETICSTGSFNISLVDGNGGDVIPTGTTYSWSAPAAISGITGLAAGSNETGVTGTLTNNTNAAIDVVYTVTPTEGNCTGASFDVTVTVAPTIVIADRNIQLCSDNTFTVSPINGSNGNVVPAGTQYSWSAPTTAGIVGLASGANATNVSGTLSNTNTTATVVTYVVTPSVTINGVTCDGAPFNVNVNVFNGGPDVDAGADQTICGNEMVTVTAVTNATQPGIWSSTGTGSITPNVTNQTISYTPSAADVATGSVYLIYTASNFCGSISDSTLITITTPPVVDAGMDVSICEGESVTLTASGATAYSWSPVGTGSISANYTVSPTVTTTYTVTGTTGACSNTDQVTVTVNSLPDATITASATAVCTGEQVTLSAVGAAGSTYVWNDGTSNIGTTQSIFVNPTVTTTYTLEVTNANGCVETNSTTITVNPLPVATVTASGATTFCAGGSVDLTASAGTSYLWSNGSQTQTITVTTGGNYSVTVTNASGCSTTSAVEVVTVNPLPIVAGITGASNVCVGSTTTLANATSGGTWSSSDASVASVSASGVVTGVSAGSVTITYSVTNGNGCTNETTASVTVNPSPVATVTASGATTFCAGGSVDLTASAGTSYLWSNGSQTQTITVTTGGNYSVTVTNASGCSTTSAVEVVTVNPLPIVAGITGASNVCVGSTTTLANATSGGTWSSSDASVASVSASGVVTGVSAGSVTITYSVTNGNGCTNETTALVTVNAAPTTPVIAVNGPTTICPSSTVTLTAPAGFTYQWSTGSIAQSITVSQTDVYTVTVTNASGCSAISAPVSITVEDVTAPTLTVPNDITISINGGCEAIVNIGDATATDNCSLQTVTNDAPSFFPIGTTTVTWTATDASGNVTTLTQEVTVEDNTAPTISAPANVTAFTDNACEATNVNLGTAIASDNCNVGLVITNDAPATYPLGVTVVTWTATDAYGNTATATHEVTVIDTIAPTIDVIDFEITLDAFGEGFIDFTDIDNGTTDNCGIASIELSATEFNCDNVGNNEITVTVTDNGGNVSTAIVNVFITASESCGDDTWNGPMVPQAFTPNGNGINDLFVIPGIDGYQVRELVVYDRYGGLVYESNEYNNDWNGTNMSGDRLPDATYYYVLKITGGKTKAGFVYINRVNQ